MDLANLENFDPRTCINGQVNRLKRATDNVFRKYISPFGVTSSQLSLLFILSKRKQATQKELSDIAILEKSSLNRNLKRLFEMKLLTNQDFPQIGITQKGLVLVNDVIPEWRKAMAEVSALFGSNGVEALSELSQQIKKQKS